MAEDFRVGEGEGEGVGDLVGEDAVTLDFLMRLPGGGTPVLIRAPRTCLEVDIGTNVKAKGGR